MPYKISRKAGGDSAKNDAAMESCVRKLTPKRGKISAIRICKSSIQKKATK